MEAVEPALDVRGVPAWHQAAVLQGPELRSSLRPGRDHLVEGVLQGYRVVVGSLVLSNTSKTGLFLGQSKEHRQDPNPRLPTKCCSSSFTTLELLAQLGAKNQGSRSHPTSHAEPGERSSRPTGELGARQGRRLTWYQE